MYSDVKVISIYRGKVEERLEPLVSELPVTISTNGEPLITLLCTPLMLEELAVGFLFSEGLIFHKREIKGLSVNQEEGRINIEVNGRGSRADRRKNWVITSGCGKGATISDGKDIFQAGWITPDVSISPDFIQSAMEGFSRKSELYKQTHGVHSCALFDEKEMLVFAEDLGRHNALDKVLGRCLLEEIPTRDKVLFTTGRVSSEILIRAARMQIPILVSRTAPTTLSTEIAERMNISVIGFVRGGGMKVYTHPDYLGLTKSDPHIEYDSREEDRKIYHRP